MLVLNPNELDSPRGAHALKGVPRVSYYEEVVSKLRLYSTPRRAAKVTLRTKALLSVLRSARERTTLPLIVKASTRTPDTACYASTAEFHGGLDALVPPLLPLLPQRTRYRDIGASTATSRPEASDVSQRSPGVFDLL